jgi:LmbE family N-acetylglucosaminyl deacetylase
MTMPRRMLVVSPHCDDAVLSCGDLLRDNPGTAVVTVFAGWPPGDPAPTDWDRRAGFAAGDDVIAARREEDRLALAGLSAEPEWLAFVDDQYGAPRSEGDVAATLGATIDRLEPSRVVIPLGLFHPDHRLAHDAALVALRARRVAEWTCYEEATYRRVPGLVDERVSALRDAGLTVTRWPASERAASDAKRRAIACYGSQLRALSTLGPSAVADVYRPERYWRVAAE